MTRFRVKPRRAARKGRIRVAVDGRIAQRKVDFLP